MWLNVAHGAPARQEPILFDVSLEDKREDVRGTPYYAGLKGHGTAPGHNSGPKVDLPTRQRQEPKKASVLPLSTLSLHVKPRTFTKSTRVPGVRMLVGAWWLLGSWCRKANVQG